MLKGQGRITEINVAETLKDVRRALLDADVNFKIDGNNEVIKIFTTRPDTLFGATYMVLAPEHPLVDEIITEQQKSQVEEYKD